MKARDAHQLRMARVWHYASAGLAMVAGLSAFIGFAQWGFMREMFGSSGHGANVFIQVILGVFLAGGLVCLALGALSMSVALNLKRLRHHRYNMIASLVTCAFVPFGRAIP